MPGSDWNKQLPDWGGLAAAIFVSALLIVLGIFPALLEQRELSRETTHHAAYYSRYAQNEIAIKCAALWGQSRANCAREINQAARENQREEYDLYSQRAMAVWTGVMGWMAVVGVSLSLVGVYLIWKTWRETGKSVMIMRLEQRPWLAVKAVASQIESVSGYISIMITAEVRNVGASPALNACFDVQCIKIDIQHTMLWHEAITTYFEKEFRARPHWHRLPTNVLPQEEPIFISSGVPDFVDESTVFPMTGRQFLIAYSLTYEIDTIGQRGQTAGAILAEIVSNAVPSDPEVSNEVVYEFRPPDAQGQSDIEVSDLLSPRCTR